MSAELGLPQHFLTSYNDKLIIDFYDFHHYQICNKKLRSTLHLMPLDVSFIDIDWHNKTIVYYFMFYYVLKYLFSSYANLA